LATVDVFAFEATAFLPVLALACFEAGFAAATPAGSADAPVPMQSQAMHASNSRLWARKRLMGVGRYRFCEPV
jgi:hypothetical protein